MPINTYIIYNTSTGQIVSTCRIQDECLDAMVPDGHSALQTDADWRENYIDVGTSQPAAKPPRPSSSHDFDWASKTWKPSASLKAQEIRAERAPLLAEADIAINQIEDRGGDAGAWREYREALRNLTAQGGFPFDVEWPGKPGAVA